MGSVARLRKSYCHRMYPIPINGLFGCRSRTCWVSSRFEPTARLPESAYIFTWVSTALGFRALMATNMGCLLRSRDNQHSIRRRFFCLPENGKPLATKRGLLCNRIDLANKHVAFKVFRPDKSSINYHTRIAAYQRTNPICADADDILRSSQTVRRRVFANAIRRRCSTVFAVNGFGPKRICSADAYDIQGIPPWGDAKDLARKEYFHTLENRPEPPCQIHVRWSTM
jgi:hypothetical protein